MPESSGGSGLIVTLMGRDKSSDITTSKMKLFQSSSDGISLSLSFSMRYFQATKRAWNMPGRRLVELAVRFRNAARKFTLSPFLSIMWTGLLLLAETTSG